MTTLRIEPSAAELRHLLGPTPWFVLEELLLGDGESNDAVFVARASARSLAVALSLNKDTVARALSTLCRAGVVTSVLQSNDGGRFGSGGYRIAPVRGVDRVDDGPTTTSKKSSRTHRTPPRSIPQPTQLTLLPLDPADNTDQLDPNQTPPPKQLDALAPGVRPGPARVPRDSRNRRGTEAGSC